MDKQNGMQDDRQTQIVQRLAASRAELLTLLQGLPPEQWRRPVFSEEETSGAPWTVSTVVGHLLESERAMSVHVHKIRTGRETLPPDFDITRWNAGMAERMNDPAPDDLLKALDETRTKTLEVMETLETDDWSRTGRHPARGEITIAQYYETIALHERMHAKDIREALGGKEIGELEIGD